MVAIEVPHWAPRESRKVALTLVGSLLLHVAALAWLPPLVRDVAHSLPPILEVRLMDAPSPPAPAAHLPDHPASVAPPRSVRRAAVAPEAAASMPATTSVPTPASSLSETDPAPAPARTAASAAPSHALVNAEPALTPPDLRAAYLSNPRPPYPLAARRLGVEGRVVLRAEILENGTCNRIAVSQSSGHSVLDNAALQAVKQWRFMPARRGGEAVAAWVEIPITFRLDGRES